MQVDCNITHWNRGPCNATCGEGYRVKTRTIIVTSKLLSKLLHINDKILIFLCFQTHPENGGLPCPKKLKRYERCHTRCDQFSNHDMNPTWGPSSRYEATISTCEYSNWSAWSPCSRTCGDYAVQQRTRYVLNPAEAQYCPHRLEERKCDIMPCLLNY